MLHRPRINQGKGRRMMKRRSLVDFLLRMAAKYLKMIRNLDGTERLYLSKGDQSIYIDNCKIPQHHIDGIRFLFRVYRKKKSGVIIYDTSGYGRNLQIVLFLKAVRHLLTQPVLVLCHEGAEHDWMEQFQTWTDLCDDVVLENQKPFIKKLVFINTMSNLPAFCRRDWGVVVMDADKLSHQVLGLPFKADYKIWVTPDNMTENLDKFSRIYKWFYPKGKFDKSEFTPDKSDPNDVIEKSIRLDAFMEDIVAKREETESSKQIEKNQKDDSPPLRVSRKNKDATGTKIKRSKRKIYDDEDDVPLSKTKKDTANVPTQSTDRKTTTKHNNDYSTDDYSIANFKRKSLEELKKHLLNIATQGEPNTDIKFSTSNSPNELKLYYEPDPADDNSDMLYEMDTQIFANDTSDDYTNDINYIIKDFAGSKRNNSDRDDVSDVEDETTNSIPNRKTRKTQVDTPRTENEETSNEILDITEDQESERGSPCIFEMKSDQYEDEKHTNENSLAESPSNRNEMKSAISELKTSAKSSQCDQIKTDIDEIKLENDVKDKTDIKNDNNIDKNEVQKISNQNELNDEGKPHTNDVAVTNSLKQNKMDDKMKEMEAKAMKKFKGSILDSLF